MAIYSKARPEKFERQSIYAKAKAARQPEIPEEITSNIPQEIQPQENTLYNRAKNYFTSNKFGEALAQQMKSGGFAGAPTATPEQAKTIAKETLKAGLIEGVAAAYAPAYVALKGRPILKGLTSLLQAGTSGETATTAESLIERGELPTSEELVKEGALWMGIDAALQLFHLSVAGGKKAYQLNKTVGDIAEKEGIPKLEVWKNLWNSTKNYVRSKFGRGISKPEDVTLADAEILVNEAKQAEKEGLRQIAYEEPRKIEFKPNEEKPAEIKPSTEKVSTTVPPPKIESVSEVAVKPKVKKAKRSSEKAIKVENTKATSVKKSSYDIYDPNLKAYSEVSPEDYQMTLKEFRESTGLDPHSAYIQHKKAVLDAYNSGKKLPDKVLQEYELKEEDLEPEHQKDFSPKMMQKQKDFIVDKLDKAIENPPNTSQVTIKVPQDGVFKINNSPDNLKLAKARVEKNWPVKPLTEGKGKPIQFSRVVGPSKLKEEVKKSPPSASMVVRRTKKEEEQHAKNDKILEDKVVSSVDIEEEKLTLPQRIQKLKTQLINQYAPLEVLLEKEAKTFENPTKLAELVDGAAGQLKQALDHGQFDIDTFETTGPGLRQIFEPRAIIAAEGKKKLDRKSFRTYLAARSSLERSKMGQKTAFTPEEAQRYLIKHRRYEPLSQEYTKFLNQNIVNLRKAGMISKDGENAMREMYLNYAPLQRVIKKPVFQGRKSKTLQPEKLPKRAKGSERTIIDPLESAIRNTAATFRSIAKNRVMNAIRDQLESMGYKASPAPKKETDKSQLEEMMGEDLSDKEAKTLSEVKNVLDPESYTPGEGKIFGYRDGKRWEMKAPQEIIDTVKGLNPAQSSFLINLLNKWRQIFSSGIVLQPGTMLRLTGLDLVVTTLQSKYPKFPVLDLPINVFYQFPKMLFEVLKKGELYQDYLKSGAAQFALQGLDREQMESMVTDITNSEKIKEYGLTDLAKDTIKLPWTVLKTAWKLLAKVSEKLGDANRLIEFKKSYDNSIDKGQTRLQALMNAAHDAFEVSIPYGRQGSLPALQEMYKIFPFMRTIVNSTISFAETMNPKNPNFLKFLSTALGALTLPTIYFYMKNRNDKRYQSIPQEDRDRNIYIYTTDDPNEEPIRIRKLWQYGFVFQTLPERVIEFIAEKDPSAFDKIFKSFEYEFSPFQQLSFSSALEDGFEFNKLFEGNRLRIIPERQRRIDASLQHTQSTSELSKKLGEYSKISPIYLDFVIGNVGGGLGQNIVRLMDEAAYITGAAEERRPEAKHADNILWGTFFARGPSKRSEQLNNFYKFHDKMTMIKSTIQELKKRGLNEKAREYANSHPYVNTDKMRQRIGKFYTAIDKVLVRATPTDDDRREKRLKLDELYNRLTAEAEKFDAYINRHLDQQRKSQTK